jgi:hypothetical protein
MKSTSFAELQTVTGTEPKRLEALVHALEKKGLFRIEGDTVILTEQGEREAAEMVLYGYPAEVLVRDVLALRNWLAEKVKRGSAGEVTLEDVRQKLKLEVKNSKVGRVLVSLGCRKRKSHGKVYYRVPRKIAVRELRDLTRTKRRHLREGAENGK